MEAYDQTAPLYAQVKQRLLDRIEAGELAEGAFLPPEPQLCEETGVSRITLRRAVKELCDEGILIRQQGRGTVVARKRIQQTLVSLSGFSEAFKGEGHVTHDILSVTEPCLDRDAASVLNTERVTMIDRLIRVDDRPLTLESLYIATDGMDDIIAAVRKGHSFFRTLRDSGGPVPTSADRLINVGFASAAQRKHLSIGQTQPVYRIEKTVHGPAGQPISFSRLITPTHLITFSLRSGSSGEP